MVENASAGTAHLSPRPGRTATIRCILPNEPALIDTPWLLAVDYLDIGNSGNDPTAAVVLTEV